MALAVHWSQLYRWYYHCSAIYSIKRLVNFCFWTNLQGAANVGNVPSAPLTGRAHQPTESVGSSHVPMIISTAAPTHEMTASSAPPLPLNTNAHTSRSSNLVTPAFFVPPSSSTSLAQPASSLMPTAPPIHPNSTASQRPAYGTPLLQPFPPPTPPASLTPAHNDGPIISRDKVKDALQRLVQVSFTLQGTSCQVWSFICFNTCLPNRVMSSSI